MNDETTTTDTQHIQQTNERRIQQTHPLQGDDNVFFLFLKKEGMIQTLHETNHALFSPL